MVSAGRRNTLIQFERATRVKDDHGGVVPTWGPYTREWAEVRFGRGDERRSAAQESAVRSATFVVLAHPLTLALTPQDRIAGYLGADWDIAEAIPRGADEVHVTATTAG